MASEVEVSNRAGGQKLVAQGDPACDRVGRYDHVVEAAQTDEMDDALANVRNRERVTGMGLDQIENAGVGDDAAVERDGLRDDRLSDRHGLGGRRRSGEDRRRGQTARPPHQKACLTRTSSE